MSCTDNTQGSILTELQAFARSILESPFNSVSNTFIFSTRQVRAVSVASPTFSYTPFAYCEIVDKGEKTGVNLIYFFHRKKSGG
jgi:hypothetical protein